MGTSKTFKDQQSNGNTSSEIGGTQEQWEHLCSELRELSLAVGEFREAIRQPNHRRVESVQGSVNQAFQSSEEALKKLQASYYPYWYANPTRDGRPMVTGWHLGFRGASGNKPDEVQRQVHDARSNEPPDTSYIQLED